MHRLVALAWLAGLGASAAPALAGPHGFSGPLHVGEGSGGQAGQTAAAVGADGTAALAWTLLGDRSESLHVALREGPGGPWLPAVVGEAVEVRDPQAVVGADGDIVLAWAEVGEGGRVQSVATVAKQRGGPLGGARRFTVGNGYGAFPRLALLRSGAILIAFRDARRGAISRLRVALRPAGSNRFSAPRSVGARAASLALAATGGGAVLAWIESRVGGAPGRACPGPNRQAGPRTRRAYMLRLGGDGRPLGERVLISRTAGGTVRLAGAEDGRSLASWMRPACGPDRPPALYTRSLPPLPRPARPLRTPGSVPRRPAAVVLAAGGEAIAAGAMVSAEPFGFAAFAAESLHGGAWERHRSVSSVPGPMIGDPRPLLLAGGEALVIWSQGPAEPGSPPEYDVVVARRAAAGEVFSAPARLGGDLTAIDGRGVAVAVGGARVLAAWPASAGGLLTVER